MVAVKMGPPLIETLKLAYPAKTSVLLEGSHGTGKSEIVQEAACQLGIDYMVIDLSLCEPTDLAGLPMLDGGRTRYAPPVLLPTEGAGLLVLEELTRAPREVQSPCLQLITARRLNCYVLPDGWQIVACMNPPPPPTAIPGDPDYYDVQPLDPALLSRFSRISVEPDARLWLDWAKKKALHQRVIDAVTASPAEALVKDGGNPRAWAKASAILFAYEQGNSPEEALHALVVGQLGPRWGEVLFDLYTRGKQPLTPEEILTNWPVVQTRLAFWRRQKRNDQILSAWDAVKRHLTALQAAPSKRRTERVSHICKAIVKMLPPNLRSAESAWVASMHFLL
jgi:hypothetical protein